jgi:hypothetical protein
LSGQRETEERVEGRVISINIQYSGKVRLYIPLYIYIVVSVGFWWKGQISADSLQTPAGWAGVCKFIFPTIVRAREEWGELVYCKRWGCGVVFI